MESIWTKTCRIPQREPLRGDLRCEVAVIGGGMAGLLTAYELQQAGHQAVVFEADRIASGQTRNTTAKITSQHGRCYENLLNCAGFSKAKAYAAANEAAIAAYSRLTEEKGIDCELETCDAYVYGNNVEKLRREAEAAAKLGLPARFVERPNAPISCQGAVRFSNQAQFHPLKFLRAISEELTVYEKTPVIAVHGGVLQTPHGKVTAQKIIFACHYPFPKLAGLFFTRLHQERSYVLALEQTEPVNGMWIGAEGEKLSFRSYGEILLLGGGGHRTGENSAGGQYATLRQRAGELFPGAREIAHWSAQDCVSPDGIPLIGRYSASRPDWYIATGFRKWGMTTSMVAAKLLRGLLGGNVPPEAAVFDPRRFRAGVLAGLACEGGHAVKGLSRSLLEVPKTVSDQLQPGHGGVVRLNGKKVGMYKEEGGTGWTVDIHCPHLGCQLAWNPEERSWDCPCHGSRFDFRGNLISGPAKKDIHLEDNFS